MSFNFAEELALLPLAGAAIAELIQAEQNIVTDQPFDIPSPVPVSLFSRPYSVDLQGTPVPAQQPHTQAVVIPSQPSWLQKEIALAQLAIAFAQEGELAYEEVRAGQAFSLSVPVSIKGNVFTVTLSGSPITNSAPQANASAPTHG